MDPVQTLQNVASAQGLLCLLKDISIQENMPQNCLKQDMDSSNNTDGQKILSENGVKKSFHPCKQARTQRSWFLWQKTLLTLNITQYSNYIRYMYTGIITEKIS